MSNGNSRTHGRPVARERRRKLTTCFWPFDHTLGYVGSTERQSQDTWVLADRDASDQESTAHRQMVRRKIEIVPALYKIFDEILVNACDNLMRDKTMDTIKIDIDRKACVISIYFYSIVDTYIYKIVYTYISEIVISIFLL